MVGARIPVASILALTLQASDVALDSLRAPKALKRAVPLRLTAPCPGRLPDETIGNMLSLLFLVALSLLHGGAAAHDLNSAAPDLNSAWPPDTPCPGNTPRTRSRWCRYSIDTDYTRHTPDTGVTREYFLELTDVVVALDGVPRPAMGGQSVPAIVEKPLTSGP